MIDSRSLSAPPRSLPDVVPEFFVGGDGSPMLRRVFPRNPYSQPVQRVTPEIAAEFPDDWAAFLAEQEALAAGKGEAT